MTTFADAFLGVEHSCLGRRWRARLDSPGEAKALAMTQTHGIDQLVARILAGRGVAIEDAARFLAPTLRELMPDPSTLQDMDVAIERLARAIETKEQIAVFGDYDVDGACSAAMMVDYWRAVGAPEPIVHIPDRITEGYGPNIDAIRDLASRGAGLLVTVDCGATGHDAFAAARAIGMDVIVLDHHLAPERLPDAIVVNPNRQDDLSGQGALCAAGVVFLALAGLSRELRRRGAGSETRPTPDLLALLDLVALATVADVAPLVGLNRAFVRRGLEVMRRRARVGLAALADAARLDGAPMAYHLGFALGPRINAGGRIGDSGLGARLLTLTDESEARHIAGQLDRLNEERRALEKGMVEEAVAEAEAQFRQTNRLACLLVGAEQWHPGIVGLIASRLREQFNVPSFAFAFNGEIATGSGRSLSGVNLGSAVRGAVDNGLALKGGGHAMAAGLTVELERLDLLRDHLNETLADEVDLARGSDALLVDGAIATRAVTIDLLRHIEEAGPFGQGNPSPVFVLPKQHIAHSSIVGGAHIRARLRAGDGAGLDAIAFRAVGSPMGDALNQSAYLHIAVKLSRNVFRGVERVEARIVDAAPA